MQQKLQDAGYLRLPLRLVNGTLARCDLEESVRRFLQLNLNVPEQGRERPKWIVADPEIGCRVPHYDFESVSRAVGGDTARLVSAIRVTADIEKRIRGVRVTVGDVAAGDAARRRKDGTLFTGAMKRVTIQCERVDGKSQELHYDVAFGGNGPVFPEDER